MLAPASRLRTAYSFEFGDKESHMKKLVNASVGHFKGKNVNTRKASGEKLVVLLEFPSGKHGYEDNLQEYIAPELRGEGGIKPTAIENYSSNTNSLLSKKIELISTASSCNLTSFFFRSMPCLSGSSLKPLRYELTTAYVLTAAQSIADFPAQSMVNYHPTKLKYPYEN